MLSTEAPRPIAAMEAPAPQPAPQVVVAEPGDSQWSLLEKHTDLTDAQIMQEIPAVNAANDIRPGEAIHPDQHVILPAFGTSAETDQVHIIRHGEIVWNLIEQRYGHVNPSMVAAVASANHRANFDRYLDGDPLILPASLATAQPIAPQVAAPAPVTPEHVLPPTTTAKIEMPKVTEDTAEWKAVPGPEVITIINVMATYKNVSPATMAGWIRDANHHLDLSKLADGQQVKIPGVTKEQWNDYWTRLKKLADFTKFVDAAAKAANAPVGPNVVVPPNIVKLEDNYVRMPDAPNGEYRFANPDPNKHSGSEALIQTNYTVALKWKELHPESPLVFEDFNADGDHVSHKNGIDVDVITADNSAATIDGSQERNIELAKLYFDTGQVEVIFFNDPVVRAKVMEYAKEKGLPGRMEYWPGHERHFHVRVKKSYSLPTYDNAPPPLPTPPPAPAPAPAPETAPSSFALTPEQSSEIDSFNLRPDQKDFLKTIIPIAKEVQAQYHTNATVDVAQAIFESDWGTSHEGNNYHGMMADGLWHGPTHTRTDWVPDGKGGRVYHEYQFKTYATMKDSFIDHAALIVRAPHYQDAMAVAGDWHAYLEALQNGGPAYAAAGEEYVVKVSGLVNDFHLDQLTK